MRPRSKLLSKRRLTLPTISEGNEDTAKDLKEANSLCKSGVSQAISSEDYLLSICHLALPTRDASPENSPAQRHNAVLQTLQRPRQLIRTTIASFELNFGEFPQFTDKPEAHGKRPNDVMYGISDPLEDLYGHPNDFSRLSGSMRRRFARHNRSANCSESTSEHQSLHSSSSSVLDVSQKHISAISEVNRARPEDLTEETVSMKVTTKPSLISRWISDFRSSWKETRARACILPAITEI